MASKAKRQIARAKHQAQKRRAKYRRIIDSHEHAWRMRKQSSDSMQAAFNNTIADLCRLNVKYLQQLLSDLKSGYMKPFPGDYHRMLQHSIELNILERTLLK